MTPLIVAADGIACASWRTTRGRRRPSMISAALSMVIAPGALYRHGTFISCGSAYKSLDATHKTMLYTHVLLSPAAHMMGLRVYIVYTYIVGSCAPRRFWDQKLRKPNRRGRHRRRVATILPFKTKQQTLFRNIVIQKLSFTSWYNSTERTTFPFNLFYIYKISYTLSRMDRSLVGVLWAFFAF